MKKGIRFDLRVANPMLNAFRKEEKKTLANKKHL